MTRHLLTQAHFMIESTLHLAKAKAGGSSRIMGLSLNAFIILVVVAALLITICCCIWVSYRRKKTRQDFNQNPEQFPNLPDLSWKQERILRKKQVKELIKGDGNVVIEKKTEDFNGPYFLIGFKGTSPQAAIYDNELKDKCLYFEIEVVSLGGEVVIGFANIDSKEKLEAKDEAIGNSGVSLSTSGIVVANGENVYNYNWNLQYGDVIGIGLTKESSKFNQRRAWISKNGVLLNAPPADEMNKWLATFQISATERQEFQKEKQKDTMEEGMNKDAQAIDKAIQASKLAYEKEQALLTSQKISVKTFKKFEYYLVVFYEGPKGDNSKDKKTVVHLNVGGQIFRMQQADFKGGVLM